MSNEKRVMPVFPVKVNYNTVDLNKTEYKHTLPEKDRMRLEDSRSETEILIRPTLPKKIEYYEYEIELLNEIKDNIVSKKFVKKV